MPRVPVTPERKRRILAQGPRADFRVKIVNLANRLLEDYEAVGALPTAEEEAAVIQAGLDGVNELRALRERDRANPPPAK